MSYIERLCTTSIKVENSRIPFQLTQLGDPKLRTEFKSTKNTKTFCNKLKRYGVGRFENSFIVEQVLVYLKETPNVLHSVHFLES